MRPLNLTMCAWGPYPEKVTVDFSRFQEGSVFLVTGPTGAGKTTIFDAISFALYGNVSGQNRDKTSVRSDFAKPDTDTFVEFTFLHKGNTYHIYRSPKYDRPKKRGEGMTTSNETAVLTMEGQAPIASLNDVNRTVEELMGINYSQFKQIAMIAQGEFLNLLYAKSEDKVKIFRNLFATQLYEKISLSLAERSKLLYGNIKEHTNKMEEAVASVDTRENEELRAAVQSENKDFEKILSLLKEDIHVGGEKARSLKQEAERINELYTKKVQEITQASEMNRNLEQLQEVRSSLLALKEQKEEMEDTMLQLTKARQAQQVEASEKLYLEACRRKEQWNEKVIAARDELSRIALGIQQLGQELEHAKELEAVIEQLKQRIQWLESLLPLYASLEEAKKQQKKLKSILDANSAKAEEITKKQTKLKEKKTLIVNQLKQYEGVEKQLGDVQVEIEKVKQRYDALKQILQHLKAIREEEASLKAIQEKYLLQEEAMNTVKERYERKERMYRQAAIGLAARYLQDNQPCPVCGSLEHPQKAVISHEVPDEAEVEKEKKLYEREQKLYNDIYNKASSKSGAINSMWETFEQMAAPIGITEQSALIEAFNESSNECKGLLSKREQLKELLEVKEQHSRQLEECDLNLEKAVADLEIVINEKQQSQREYDVLQGSIANLIVQLPKEYEQSVVAEQELVEQRGKLQGYTLEVEKIQAKKEQLYAQKERVQALLASHEAQYSSSEVEVTENQNQFQQATVQAGFTSQQEYEKAKLTQEEIVLRENKVQAYKSQLTSFEEQEKQLLIRTKGKEKVDVESMKEELEEIKGKKDALQIQSEELNASISCNKRAYASLKEKLEKVEDVSLEYGYVKDLEKAARGQNNEKLVFEHYVLASYFEEILAAANLRLSVMTNSRYELMKVSSVGDRRTTNSLDLEVLDQYTGKRRSVKTLSGGESFKAALSLALGLSDIIQQNTGGIEIDTLFIDEGFGSLDSESLDMALKTLTTLTGKNRLIGIISHVSELKERVDNQIIIERTQVGSRIKMLS